MEYSKDFILQVKDKFGLPCYVFDEDEFVNNYLHLENVFRKEYPKYQIALSYKTNYAPKICSIVKKLGGYAEVVSDMEYDIAKKVGYSNNKIIYNGPFKGPKFDEHLLNGGILNIDNLDEVDRVVALANRTSRDFKVGIRVNIDIGQNFVSRFGIDADSNDLSFAVKKISDCKYTKLVGLHCHIGRSRGTQYWENRTKKMLNLSDEYIDGNPEFIDLGSGMFGDVEAELKNQFSTNVPSYEEYASVTARMVNNHYKSLEYDEKPILFTEPGTTLDNRYISLISEIDGIKNIKGKSFAILNSSFHNLGDVSGSIKLPLKVVKNSTDRHFYQDIDFVGYTCLERDVLYGNFSGEIAKGDYVVFGNVGGYSNVDKPPFILPQCAMIGIGGDKIYVIKRKETTEDILSTYILGE